ncbi:hypothetical protein BDV10DRAFT_200018 [Aspergillus recurvatus]
MSSPPNPSDPAVPPPPGVESNFVDPPSRQASVIIMASIFVPLMFLAVLTRVYVRTRIIKIWGWDDTTCVLAAIGSLANMASYLKLLDLGLGLHMWDIPVDIFMSESNARFLAANITYPWTVGFAKLSILLLYKRLFPTRREKLLTWIGIGIVGTLYTGFIIMAIVNIATCVTTAPGVNHFCDFVHEGLVIWQAAVNVFTDFYVVVLPIPCVVKLQTSVKRKVGLVLTFASGLGACGASLARLIISVIGLQNNDSMWQSAELALYSIAEINIGIIVACVCTFPIFFGRLRESNMSSSVTQFVRSLLHSSRASSSSSSSSSSSVLPVQQQGVIRAAWPSVSDNGKSKYYFWSRAREDEVSFDFSGSGSAAGSTWTTE